MGNFELFTQGGYHYPMPPFGYTTFGRYPPATALLSPALHRPGLAIKDKSRGITQGLGQISAGVSKQAVVSGFLNV